MSITKKKARGRGFRPPAPCLDVVSLCLPLGCSRLVDRLITRARLSGLYVNRAALKVYVPRGRWREKAIRRSRHKEVIYRAHDEAIIIVNKAVAPHEESKRKR